MLNSFIIKVKRKENNFYRAIYNLGKFIIYINFPSIKWLHFPLYNLHVFIKSTYRWIIHFFWSVPVFKARCDKVGKNLRLPNGIPLVTGSNLKIFLGDNVTLGRTTLTTNTVFKDPVLRIGNNVSIGAGTRISIAQEVTIGDNTMIAGSSIIIDNDGHPANPNDRLLHKRLDKDEIKPVKIGNNVWIGNNCAILKGVTIGNGSIISTHSVVARDAQENCIYSGFPARPTARDIDKL